MLTLDFIFVMMATGSAVGLLADILGAPWWLAITIAAVTALLLILFLRRPLRRALHRNGDDPTSNVDALVGSVGVAVSPITSLSGQARLGNGETWTARSAGDDIAAGGVVVVESVSGAHVIVRARPQGK
ncbi:NfeD family protein [Mycetocola reblochoni]|uniref:NfeD family protein n=2 Tax=Mycetocola reblochoni TaxID=331618 RepID=A0A3L6ZP11_9MICO|nr:NfeD family protein [Mycetocola reblochoni]